MDEVFKQGFESYSKNKRKLSNPYENGSNHFNEFERGWIQALKRSGNFFAKSRKDEALEPVTEKSLLNKRDINAQAYANRKGY